MTVNKELTVVEKAVQEVNQLAKVDSYRISFSNLENSTLLDREHFLSLLRIMYASDIVFDISMPNEIFSDLALTSSIRIWKHRAFAFSFYYFISYLWRSNIHHYLGDKMQVSQMKLKYYITGTKESPTYDYLVKNNGVLCKLGYTQRIFDIPVEYQFYKKNLVHIKMLSELKEEGIEGESLPKKLMIHKPLKGYYKYPKIKGDNSDNELDGHFFSQNETFKIKAETFLAIISTKDLGFGGFYFYCYLRFLQEVRKGNSFKKSKEEISQALGINLQLIQQYTSRLKKMKLIQSKQMAIKDFNTYSAMFNIKEIVLI